MIIELNPLKWFPKAGSTAAVSAAPAYDHQAQIKKVLAAVSTTAEAEESNMNIFSKIAGAEHTFAAWVEKELGKLSTEAPTIEKIADTVLTYAGGAIQAIITAEGGAAAGAIVGKVLSAAHSDLLAASGLIYDFGANPTAASMIGSVQTNLSGLLAAGGIKSAPAVTAANKVVTELDTLVTALAPSAVAGQ